MDDEIDNLRAHFLEATAGEPEMSFDQSLNHPEIHAWLSNGLINQDDLRIGWDKFSSNSALFTFELFLEFLDHIEGGIHVEVAKRGVVITSTSSSTTTSTYTGDDRITSTMMGRPTREMTKDAAVSFAPPPSSSLNGVEIVVDHQEAMMKEMQGNVRQASQAHQGHGHGQFEPAVVYFKQMAGILSISELTDSWKVNYFILMVWADPRVRVEGAPKDIWMSESYENYTLWEPKIEWVNLKETPEEPRKNFRINSGLGLVSSGWDYYVVFDESWELKQFPFDRQVIFLTCIVDFLACS